MTADSRDSLRIVLPEDVKKIINVLRQKGYEAYAVGGCVRDSLLGREPKDWDITTSALPLQVKELFRRTIDTGIQHGTVTVMLGKKGYEVTTYRIDGDYEDSRHPKNVEFTSDLILDLERRDFTINAMAYNEEKGIVDVFDGIGDLQKGIIRCVGKAADRFGEDALRILRAVRFSAQLGFSIEEETAKAVVELAGNLERISKERIHTELNKMLLSGHPEYFLLADGLGIMKIILPEYYAMSREQKEFAGRMAARCALRLPERYAAMLLFAAGAPGNAGQERSSAGKEAREGISLRENDSLSEELVKSVLKSLKLDNDTINTAGALARWCGVELTKEEGRLRHIIHDAGPDRILRIMEFRRAYEQTRQDMALEQEDIRECLHRTERQLEGCREILDRGDCVTLKGLAVTGRDLMAAGVPAGKELGDTLERMLDLVLDDPELNEKDKLLKLIES